VWRDTRPWLNGDQFDTAMNYIFLNSVADFIAKKSITAEQFASLLAEIRAMYKLPAYNSLWNLLGSHDTERFLFSAKENVALLKLAALIQFTYIGSPVVYYGDEVGMTGDDMQARRGMIWDQNKINTDLLNFYKKIIKIRKTNNELTSGDLKIIFTDNANGIFAFVRSIDNSEILVIINSGLSDYRYSLEKKYINLLDEAAAENFIEIPKESGAVLKKVI
ncbi:MAG: alpha-glycosidase, partial [Spirochaetes bacterium]|nr:alpha-glycosidase [Spirochaetota bacterium]